MKPDVLIYGAGVIGCAIAREVAAAGATVLVVERGRPGGEASGAAAGLLTPQSHAPAPGPFVDLGRASLELYPSLALELLEETSVDVGFRMCGTIRIPAGESDELEMSRLLSWQTAAGMRAEPVREDRLAELTRHRLAPQSRRGIEFPDEGMVEARLLIGALWKSAEARGARFLLGESVESLRISRNRCTGVMTASGPVDAAVVVNAAGSWSGPPVRPIRGQIVELAAGDAAPSCPILRGDFYAVPHAGGRVLLGSTQEDVGFEKKVTAQAVRQLLDGALELIPGLSAAEVSGTWSGFRPGTPDSLPLLGETSVEGLLAATGHFRNGILLAPVTARILAAIILGRESPFELEPFRAERFAFTPQNESW